MPVAGAPAAGGPVIGGLNGGIQSLGNAAPQGAGMGGAFGALGSAAAPVSSGAVPSQASVIGQMIQQMPNAHPVIQGAPPSQIAMLLAAHPDLLAHPAFGGVRQVIARHGLGLDGRMRPDGVQF